MANENFVKLFEKSFKENWDGLAMTDYVTKSEYKYKDVAEQIAKLHILFDELHIQKDDKIALVGRNTPVWAMTFLAVSTYGAIIVPILQDFHTNDIHHIIEHSDASIVFLSDNIWENLDKERIKPIRAIFSITENKCLYENDKENISQLMDTLSEKFNKKYSKGFCKEDVCYKKRDENEVVEINYTSGSTGFSKGVMLTCKNLSKNIQFAMGYDHICWHKEIVTFLPLAHAYGCAFDLLAQVVTGSHITFLNRVPSPKILLTAFAEIKPDAIISVPLVIEKVYKTMVLPALKSFQDKLESGDKNVEAMIYKGIKDKLYSAFGGNFKEMIIGGAAFNKEVSDFLARIGFPYTVGYGMTECGPLISYAPHEIYKPGSSGKLISYLEMKIKDSADPENIPGEMLVRGDHVMVGYYKNPEATEATLDKDGWLHTGDMGTIDKDGFVFIKGRCKSMILGPSGQNIYPETIESKLVNKPFVSECIVTTNDSKIVALVYPDFALAESQGISKEDLNDIMENNRKTLNTELASYEAVNKIVIRDSEFEKTPKKNIKRYLYENLNL